MSARAAAYPSLGHLMTLSDDVGVIQHAIYDVPNRATGYCTDDVARGFMVALRAAEHGPDREAATRLVETYLAFLHDAQLPDGRFHNLMGYDRNWQDLGGSEDAFGRAVWALGFGLRYAGREGWRAVCRQLFERAFARLDEPRHLRPIAYCMLGLTYALENGKDETTLKSALARLSEALVRAYEEHRAPAWSWFEETMTYDNARLPEALLRAGSALRNRRLIDVGTQSLAYYETVVVESRIFVPIGNDGWYTRGGGRARYAQQPLEAAALVDAALAARAAVGDPRYEALARIGLDWFLGRNSAGAYMVSETGGCRDGIDRHGVNQNMGAESTLAYLWSAMALARAASEVVPIAR
jgi:hypothetical protein